MDAKLKSLLNTYDLNNTDIISIFQGLDNIYNITLYSSNFEGLGNEYSDIDVYVFIDGSMDQIKYDYDHGHCLVKKINLMEKVWIDIEYWPKKTLAELIIKVRSGKIDITIDQNLLKMLVRLHYGTAIKGCNLIDELCWNNLLKFISTRFYKFSKAILDDSNKMYLSNDPISALFILQPSLQCFLKSINALHGNVNLSDKYSYQIFNKNNGYDFSTASELCNTFIFPFNASNDVDNVFSRQYKFINNGITYLFEHLK